MVDPVLSVRGLKVDFGGEAEEILAVLASVIGDAAQDPLAVE